MKLFRVVELIGVTLLLCELGGSVGLSLSRSVSTGDCGWNRRWGVGTWISTVSDCEKRIHFWQTPIHSLLKKKRKLLKPHSRYTKYTPLKYFCNQNSIGIPLEPLEAKLLRSLHNVFIHYYVSFPKPMWMYTFYGYSMRHSTRDSCGCPDWTRKSRQSPALRMVSTACSWLASRRSTSHTSKKGEQLWSNASLEQQYQLQFLLDQNYAFHSSSQGLEFTLLDIDFRIKIKFHFWFTYFLIFLKLLFEQIHYLLKRMILMEEKKKRLFTFLPRSSIFTPAKTLNYNSKCSTCIITHTMHARTHLQYPVSHLQGSMLCCWAVRTDVCNEDPPHHLSTAQSPAHASTSHYADSQGLTRRFS